VDRNYFLDLVAAIVPAAEREQLIYRHSAEPAGVSLLLGLAELFLGTRVLWGNALASFQQMSDAMATHVMDKVDPLALSSFDARLAISEGGLVVWLTWALHPFTWLLASIPLVGLARLTAFAVSRDVVGEPFVWVGLRAGQGIARLGRALRERRRFGPLRPDRVVREPGWDLVVLAARPKPEWNERVTLAIGPGFYRLHRVEERPDRRWRAWAFLLKEAEPDEVFRGLLRYDPPAPPRAR
jgi:hypothetical protein